MSTKVSLREAVLGAWELVSYTIETEPDGDITYPLGQNPIGLILYTMDGYMSAQLMRADRSGSQTLDGTGVADTAFASGYLAYSGPYDVDETTGTLYHHVTVSLFPKWLGTTQLRCSHLEGDVLRLSASNTTADGVTSTHTLHWKRALRQ